LTPLTPQPEPVPHWLWQILSFGTIRSVSRLTDFLVHTVVEAAKRTVHESEFVELSRRDKVAFVEALLNPPTPNANLREAMERHAEVVVS